MNDMAEANVSATTAQRSADVTDQCERDVLFIHPSEHSNLTLTSSPLDDTNFIAWKRAVYVSLGTKMKLGFIGGTFPRPALGSIHFEQWRRVDLMVTSWIWNSMSKDIVESFKFCATSLELWLAIQARYGRSNGPMIYQLQREISSISQCNLSLTEYLTKVTKLWNEINCLAPMPKSAQVMQFLMGLHDSFNNERSQILMLDPLPDIEKAFSMVCTVEKQRAVHNELEANSGHMAYQMTEIKRKRKAVAANVEIREEGSAKTSSQNITEIVAEVLKVMQKNIVATNPLTSYANYAQFDEEFASNTVIPTGINENCWIIDTGAMNHVCSNIDLFQTHAKLSSPHYIHLPDGSKRLVQYTGIVNLNNEITLENVLFVPQFSVNLLPIPLILLLFVVVQLTPTAILHWKTPYEILFGCTPQYSHLRTFGSLCYATDLNPHKSKFHSRALRCILIGYAMHQKAYKLFVLDKQSINFSRDVHFYENVFPFSGSLSSLEEPRSYSKAVKHVEWRTAMQAELDPLEQNCTWKLVPLHGFNQIAGVDYNDNFSPVAKTVIVRLFLMLAAARGWPLQQLDVNNAFLHGHLEEDLYMSPPEGYSVDPSLVCKLERSIYGLKQASHQWNAELTLKLTEFGFRQSAHDHCLFTKVKDYLHSLFTIKDLGDARYFLSLEIARSTDGLYIAQTKYAQDIIQDMGLSTAKATSTPFPLGLKLNEQCGALLGDPERYRRLVGRLLYLGFTRPDISHAVQQLSQYLTRPVMPIGKRQSM
ncbi:UNVERIFIED_CONTAM: Retrovirus-related Pol polyprotein from transposon RE2 [Sesamum radiatum]|uniref:Retrovirus-related Pol polyprotein from transposon RE2 n=1 Tax=Sesamum radiatum TaxID=300843 RepID=A0AAW2TTI4_SESRA